MAPVAHLVSWAAARSDFRRRAPALGRDAGVFWQNTLIAPESGTALTRLPSAFSLQRVQHRRSRWGSFSSSVLLLALTGCGGGDTEPAGSGGSTPGSAGNGVAELDAVAAAPASNEVTLGNGQGTAQHSDVSTRDENDGTGQVDGPEPTDDMSPLGGDDETETDTSEELDDERGTPPDSTDVAPPEQMPPPGEDEEEMVPPPDTDGPCPPSPPTVGDSCDDPAVFCSYGDSPQVGCRDRFFCNLGSDVWVATTSMGGGLCAEQLVACSSAPEGSCESPGERCASDDDVCSCRPEQTESCGGDGCYELDPPIPQQWSCQPATPLPRGEGCPVSIPNAGRPCDDPTFSCQYGEDCVGLIVGCVDGYYLWELALCP